MATIELVSPELQDAPPPAGLRPAPRRTLGPDARLVLIDNGKPRAKDLLLMIAERMREGGYRNVRVLSKSSASAVLDDAQVAELAASADAVIAGLGDCGACSACSLADAIRMEAAGVPATVVISDVFIAHVASFAKTLGMPGYHSAVVPHPVSSKDDAQLRGFAAAVADQVRRQIETVDATAAA